MSKRHNRQRRLRKQLERRSLLDCLNRFLSYDELHESLQKVVLQMAMSFKGHHCNEDRAMEVALTYFCSAAKQAGSWPSMYALSRLVKPAKV